MDLKQPLYDAFFDSDVGLVRKANEDSYGYALSKDIQKNGDLFIVCDGMGGHVGGQIASQLATSCIIDFFKKEFHNNPSIAINNAILFANEQILIRAEYEPELKGMGTTCTVVLIRDNEVYLGHVGDSRIYLMSDNQIHRLTKDHSYVQTLVDKGEISDEEMELHPRKNELTQALGATKNVEPTISPKPFQFKNNDTLLMCSDGLCGLVNDKEIFEKVKENKVLSNAYNALKASVYNAGAHDNVTIGFIRFTNSSFEKTDFVKVGKAPSFTLTSTQDQDIKGKIKKNTLKKYRVPIAALASVLVVSTLIMFLLVEKPVGDGNEKGSQGQTGTQEADGSQGEGGQTGTQGADGAHGEGGQTGTQGADGAHGEVDQTDIQGADGAQGEVGQTGTQGADGAHGEVDQTDIQGADGAHGEVDQTGSQGADRTQQEVDQTGNQGADGAQGEVGQTGTQDSDGAAKQNEQIDLNPNQINKKEVKRKLNTKCIELSIDNPDHYCDIDHKLKVCKKRCENDDKKDCLNKSAPDYKKCNSCH